MQADALAIIGGAPTNAELDVRTAALDAMHERWRTAWTDRPRAREVFDTDEREHG